MDNHAPEGTERRNRQSEAYDLYGARLYGYLMTVVRSSQAAEDILQEIFCKLAARGRWFAPEDPERYLFRAAHNEARRWLRNARRAHAALADAEPVAAPSDVGEEERRDEALKSALATLPPEQAEVVHLKIHENMTFAQIGALVGCPANTAASRYRYACEKLRDLLGGLADE